MNLTVREEEEEEERFQTCHSSYEDYQRNAPDMALTALVSGKIFHRPGDDRG